MSSRLVSLAQSLGPLQAYFNRHVHDARVLVIVSPT
jgi:hypothetical protein